MAMIKNTAQRSLLPFPAMLPATMLLVATASCMADAGLDPALLGDVDLTPVTAAGDQWNSCTTWDCGKNHPLVGLFRIDELSEAGIPSPDDFRITGLTRFGVPLQLEVENGVMRGYNGVASYNGPALLGSILTVTNPTHNETWEIEIYNMTSGGLPYWAGGGSRAAYHLRYRVLGTRPWQNLCNAPLEPSEDPLWPDALETYAFLIDDERYDRDAKQALAGNDAEGWFNIACAGSTLAKMVLLHYDPNVAAVDPVQTFPYERTAVIKMLTADYLGIGEAFTQAGTKLKWADKLGLYPPPAAGISEAVWDENGAVCLDQPRLTTVDPDIYTKIQDKCLATPGCAMPPKCSTLGITDQNWTQFGIWRSWW
jgi:hypothetical protein